MFRLFQSIAAIMLCIYLFVSARAFRGGIVGLRDKRAVSSDVAILFSKEIYQQFVNGLYFYQTLGTVRL